MSLKNLWPMLKQTFFSWDKHEGQRLGASLAFYTVLSLSPLVILVVALVSVVLGKSSAQADILAQVKSVVGSDGGLAVQLLMDHAQKSSSRSLASALGFVTLLFGASAVFAELRSALNKIWDVNPEVSSGFRGLIRERFFSVGMLLSIVFLLIVSLVLSTLLGALGTFFEAFLPAPAAFLHVLDFLISFIGIAVLFGLIFKFVPDKKIAWKDVRLGALMTALLFTIGKTLIGLYLGKSGLGSPYGAAGSLVVVTVWVYYSAQIFFFGAEFTHIYADFRKQGALQQSQ